MSGRTISVVIPTLLQPDARPGHAGALWVESALRSVRAQTIAVDTQWRLEVVVGLDANAPEPDSRLLGTHGVEVRWCRADRPGRAAAANAAVQAAAGTVLAFLDDDDRWDPRWLASATQHVGRFELVSASQQLIDLSDNPVAIFDFAVPSTWVMCREVWEASGGMDEALWCHADTDFLGRVNAAGRRRLHIVERGAAARASKMLKEVARCSAILEASELKPLVTRSVNPTGITVAIRTNRDAAATSLEIHRILLKRYGCFPY